MKIQTGQRPFVFSHCEDLHTLPRKASDYEVNLHGGFAVDRRPGYGHVYYGMPGCGLIRVSPDLTTQEIITLGSNLAGANFHSTKIGEFDGKIRLFMSANDDAMVAVLSLEGDIDFILPKPEFEEYRVKGNEFHPTDTTLEGKQLFVADGYGANYISVADVGSRRWTRLFGGKTENIREHGRFGTAHGMNRSPGGAHLVIADRPHARLEICTFDGHFDRSFSLPAGSRPCGIDYIQWKDHSYAAVGSLDDPVEGKPAPIYILDAETYAVISTIRPKEDLGIEKADHIHNVVWHEHDGNVFLICQSWNPGLYFVLEMID
jgi:hypothetical protein